MGVEGEEVPLKTRSGGRYAETLLGRTGEEFVGGGIYETTLLTSLMEYSIILFFALWLIVEYFYNVYEQEYFGSFNPVFLIVILMAASGYGFTRLVTAVGSAVRTSKNSKTEDDY